MPRKPKTLERKSRSVSSSLRDETLVKRSLYFPQYVWEAVEIEAKRQKRSLTSQIEWMLCNDLRIEEDLKPPENTHN